MENKTQNTFNSLNKFALWYLACELSYAALLAAIGVVIFFGSLIARDVFYFGYYAEDVAVLAIALPYGLAYIGNLVVGIWSLFLYIIDEREGLPGMGLLLNWAFVITLFWAFLVLLVIVAASL